MHDVSLAFLWHQHQPYYPDDVGGENPMPWVRLHGTKDYWGMAMLLDEVPEMHATINLVPSLLLQLTGYTERGMQDEHLRISRLPADALSEGLGAMTTGMHGVALGPGGTTGPMVSPGDGSGTGGTRSVGHGAIVGLSDGLGDAPHGVFVTGPQSRP